MLRNMTRRSAHDQVPALHHLSGFRKYRQRSRNIYQFARPSVGALREVASLRRGREFDRDFYLSQEPRINAIARRFPVWHYVTLGHREGRLPNSNALSTGVLFPVSEREQFYTKFVSREPIVDDQRFCVVLHLHYRELSDEFMDLIRTSGIQLDLYVTVTHSDSEKSLSFNALAESIWEIFPTARIGRVPNRGRDIYPFLHLLRFGLLDKYDAVCKLHSKRSPHRIDGNAWRMELSKALLPPGETAALLGQFLRDTNCGILVADGAIDEISSSSSAVLRNIQRILADSDEPTLCQNASYPAGSMYWVKPSLLKPIKELSIALDAFEPEAQQLDGTTAHAFERIIGSVIASNGARIDTPSGIARKSAGAVQGAALDSKGQTN